MYQMKSTINCKTLGAYYFAHVYNVYGACTVRVTESMHDAVLVDSKS